LKAALKCDFSNQELKDEIEGELRQETVQPTGRISAVWGWFGSKLPAWPKK
jgi:hypothetical protein